MTPPRKVRPWPRPEGEAPIRVQQDIAAWSGIIQAVADQERGLLRRLAAQIREGSGALFVAIARGAAGGRGVSFVAVDGPPGIEAALGHERLAPIWRAALGERRAIFSEARHALEGGIAFPGAADGVLAIPLEARAEVLGLLVAGTPPGTAGVKTRATVDLCASVVALALAEERREGRMRERDQLLAALLDSMENAVLLLGPGGEVRLSNARLPELLGLEPGQMERIKSFENLLAAVRGNFRDAGAAETRWREIQRRDDEVAWDEVELARPERRVLERFARPVRDAAGERLGWLELYREADGDRLLRSGLPQAEKLVALGRLVSGVAHELNNPLTSILGYAQLQLGRGSPEGPGEAARQIFEEAQRASAIVRNLLLFVRDETPARRRVQLNEIVKQVKALRGYELRLGNILLRLDLEPELPEVLADAQQMHQLVLNLLLNAEQAIASGRGQGEIVLRTGMVRRDAHRMVRLEVHDDGPGIPKEILSRIFDSFFTTKPAGLGTGLGLSIVQAIARDHGGEIRVESEPGGGATFFVELRAAPAAERPFRQEAETFRAGFPEPVTVGTRLEPYRVLVVEDEATVANLVADVLREEGHEVVALLDSVEALERISREHFDLLICDLKMPQLDGQKLYEEAKRRGRTGHESVLFITGDTLRPRTLEFAVRDGLPYLAKPFLVEELRQAVRGLRSHRAGRASITAQPGRPWEADD